MGRPADGLRRLAAAALWIPLAGCSTEPDLTVAVAASFRDAAACADRAPGEPIAWRAHSGGSALLAQQILRGAPVDVFVSASPDEIERVRKAGLLASPPRTLADNRLILVAPREAGLVTRLTDLARPAVRRVAVPDPSLAPAGRYAERALIEHDLTIALADKRIPAADVRHARALLTAGEVDAAFLYATDVPRDDVRWNAIVVSLAEPRPRVTAAAIDGPRRATARLWIERFEASEVRACLESLGFRPEER